MIITIIIIIKTMIYHILLSDINYLNKKKNNDNVGNIGIDVSTNILS